MQLEINGRLSNLYDRNVLPGSGTQAGNWIAALAEAKAAEQRDAGEAEESLEAEKTGSERGEAAKIYEAARAGKPNPLENLRQTSKVPYEHLAKDGVITYNGVVFVCDERTNSICLGDMTDSKEVLTIALSGGGNLKVNRANIGDLSKAAGMFSPADLNLIMRAIARDTRIQSAKQEIDDMDGKVCAETGAENTETEERTTAADDAGEE